MWPLEEDEKQDMIRELDAVVAHLYGLTEDLGTHLRNPPRWLIIPSSMKP